MSPPLPIPSKAALRTLRGIALGTSCAIGVIVEDRRRRISTLKTVASNKEKLRSSRRYYHNSSEPLHLPLDDAAVVRYSLQWHEVEANSLGKDRIVQSTDQIVPRSSVLGEDESQDSSYREAPPKSTPIPQTSSLPSPPSSPPYFMAFNPHFSPGIAHQIPVKGPISPAKQTKEGSAISQPDPSTALWEQQNALLRSIGNALASKEQKGLDRTISTFMSNVHTIPSSPHITTWLKLSARLSKECQEAGKWEDASRILTAIIELGPLEEAKYLAHNPLSIIEFHLRPPTPETLCSTESVFSAAKIFLAKFEKSRLKPSADMERIGRALMLEALSLHRFNLAHRIFWRILGWTEDPEAFIRWAIHIYFEHQDHKSVIKLFLVHYSRMTPSAEHFHEAVEYVVRSVEAMKGLRAIRLLEAFAWMECPENTRFQEIWIVRLLRTYWDRYEDPYKAAEFFEKVESLMLLDKVSNPEVIYSAVVEIMVKSGNEELAMFHSKRAMREFPDLGDEIALKLVLFKARAGDWHTVVETFRQVRPNELSKRASYDGAFIPVLKVWAESHSATETRDFAVLFIRDMGVKFHRFMVTLVANKFGEAHDIDGFMQWLRLCNEEGFALDPGFCNSLLFNCWETWKLSFPELRMIHAKFEAISPRCTDETTSRILSQAAQRETRGYGRVRSKAIAVGRLAYLGRSTNKREIYEAMNQEVMNNKPMSAVMIYKRAIRFGMPFCSHCQRLAVLAAFRRKEAGSAYALSVIKDAHAQGHEVGAAMTTYIKCEIDAFPGGPDDLVIHLRNLISRLESSQIAVGGELLAHMAATCARVGEHTRAIALCNLARHRSGSSQHCFSTKSFKALATAYSQLLDINGFGMLLDSLFDSQFSTDKAVRSHLKSVGRHVQRMDPSNSRTALLEMIENAVNQLRITRAETRAQGSLISQEALRIVGNALVDLQKDKSAKSTSQNSEGPSDQLVPI